MKYVLILITLLVLLPSCSKKRSIHIVAKNAATGEAYGGLEYVILSSRTTADGEDFRTEASGTLTASGEVIEEVKVRGSRTTKCGSPRRQTTATTNKWSNILKANMIRMVLLPLSLHLVQN